MATLNPRIVNKLKQIPAVAVDAAAQAMEDMAQEIVDQMKAIAPVDKGDLRDGIGWTWGEVPKGSFTIAEVRSGNNRGDQYATLKINIYAGGNDTFWARFQEFGTVDNLGGQPFFFPTWKKNKTKFRARIRKAVKAAIKQEFGK